MRGFPDMAQAPGAGRSTRANNLRSSLHQLFSGRSSVGRTTKSHDPAKTPRFTFGRQSFSPRLVLTHTTTSLTRSPNSPSASTPHPPSSSYSLGGSYRPIVTADLEQQVMADSAGRQRYGRVGQQGEQSSKMHVYMKNKQARKYFIFACIYLVCLLAVFSTCTCTSNVSGMSTTDNLFQISVLSSQMMSSAESFTYSSYSVSFSYSFSSLMLWQDTGSLQRQSQKAHRFLRLLARSIAEDM
jgi:hypothetical protein